MTYYIQGEVVDGNKIGRTLGFPTANILVDGLQEPQRNGVYAARVLIDQLWHNGVANIGVKPSVGGSAQRVLEVHIFDLDADLYGKSIGIELGKFIRDERRFDSFAQLKSQITQDKEDVKRTIKI